MRSAAPVIRYEETRRKELAMSVKMIAGHELMPGKTVKDHIHVEGTQLHVPHVLLCGEQAGSPITLPMDSPPPVILPDTAHSRILKEDIRSLPSIISFPAPMRPPTESVVPETWIVTSCTVQPVICAGADGS